MFPAPGRANRGHDEAGVNEMGRVGGLLSREFHIDPSPFFRVVRAARADPPRAILIVGVVLRVLAYLWNRDYWLDEASLMGNIHGKAIFDFSNHYSGDQLAPMGFLIVQRVIVKLLGISGYATRLLPLACGIGSLWLFRALALRWLRSPGVLVAMVLFAFSDDLVYYSSEVKPYISDLLIGLALSVLASGLVGKRASGRELLVFALLAVASPWFSFPSMFITAGCGTAILIDRCVRKHFRDLGWLLAIAGLWTASAGSAYLVSTWLLNPTTTMYVFWNFAFLPVPPADWPELLKLGGVLLEVFVNPLNLLLPGPPALGVILPLALFLLGSFSLGRREWAGFLILALPIALALAAAALRKFPFHGRLILELVPAFYLMIAEGTDWLRPRIGKAGYTVVLVLLLSLFCLSTLYELTAPRVRPFNSHGDLHDNRFTP